MSVAASCLVLPAIAEAQDAPSPSWTEAQIRYSPYPEQNFPNQVFFGDTHLHTAFSTDAGIAGCTLGPEDAYRFSRGTGVERAYTSLIWYTPAS